MADNEWLAERKKGVGGSDAGAIIGLSKWATLYTVWADKTGRLPEKEDTEAMRLGRDLEQYVAERWCEATGKKVKRCNAILRNDEYPFALANVDRMVVGENAGLECKTTSTLDTRQFGNTEFPVQYYAQCVHYMAVTGAERWYLAVLVFGRGFYTYTLERDQSEIDALMGAEREFWKYVETDTPPTPDGMEATTDAIETVYPESKCESVDLFGRDALLDEYFEIKAQIGKLEERLREIQNVICVDLGEAERGECDKYRIVWGTQQRKTFQVKDFQRDYPDLDLSRYFKISSSRPFRVTERKDRITEE